MFEIADHLQRGATQRRGIGHQLLVSLIEILIPAFVLPRKIIFLPDIRVALTTANASRPPFESEMIARGIIFCRGWVLE